MKQKSYDIMDSCALLAYFFGEPEEPLVKEMFKKARKHHRRFLLSAIQYGEVLLKIESDISVAGREKAKRAIATFPLRIISVDKKLTEIAATFKARGGIAYADCFALALAAREGSAVVTKDPEFKKFRKDVKIRWLGK
jgi:ribonuclease VapC